MGKKRNPSASSTTAGSVLLGIMLLPTIAATAPSGGNTNNTSEVCQPAISTDTATRALRSRRSDNSTDENDYPSRSTLRDVSQYLTCLSSREVPPTELTAKWNQFHGWCDGQIRKFAARYYRTASDIDDCTQETWIDLTRRLKDFDLDASRGKFTSWLYTLVRNNAVDLSRVAGRQRAASLNDSPPEADPKCPRPNPLEAFSRKVDAQRIRQAVEQLKDHVSAESYEIARMRWIDQRSIHEVQSKLNLTANQIWAREHRLREKLRRALEPIVNE